MEPTSPISEDKLTLLIEEDTKTLSESTESPELISIRNRMPWGNYLITEELRGFKRYKYSAVDTSPLSNYVMHPFWNWLVPYVPRAVAPNTLTLSGFLLICINFAILSYYDYDFKAATNPDRYIPTWIWLIIAFNHFWAHTLDGLDGKHARRTDSSSPLGELFDHGLDSWVTTLHVLCIYSVFGRDWEFGIPTFRMYFALWLMLILFSLSHWEKYNTGILYLPWGYDFSQLIGLIVYLITAFAGQAFWHFKVPVIGISSGTIFELSLYAGAVFLTIPTTLRNIWRAYRSKTLKHSAFSECMRPLSTIIILFGITIAWALLSPMNILEKELRTFSWMTGTICANITCALIITQMSLTKARWLHWLLTSVFLVFLLVTTVPPLGYHEVVLLYVLAGFVTIAHIHYGISVVLQMSNFLNIYPFSIEKPPSHSLHQKGRLGVPKPLTRIEGSVEDFQKCVGEI